MNKINPINETLAYVILGVGFIAYILSFYIEIKYWNKINSVYYILLVSIGLLAGLISGNRQIRLRNNKNINYLREMNNKNIFIFPLVIFGIIIMKQIERKYGKIAVFYILRPSSVYVVTVFIIAAINNYKRFKSIIYKNAA